MNYSLDLHFISSQLKINTTTLEEKMAAGGREEGEEVEKQEKEKNMMTCFNLTENVGTVYYPM